MIARGGPLLVVPAGAGGDGGSSGGGLADPGSLQMPAQPALVLGLVLLVPAVLTLWSVHRDFGVERALGGDHFEVFSRILPPVRRGAFAWTGNARYAFACLILWSVALLTRSHAALVLALFQLAAIWAHYHGTERPDLELIHPAA